MVQEDRRSCGCDGLYKAPRGDQGLEPYNEKDKTYGISSSSLLRESDRAYTILLLFLSLIFVTFVLYHDQQTCCYSRQRILKF